MKSFNKNAAIRGAIRRVFARSPIVREVLFDGRREVPKYNKDGSRSIKNSVQYSCQVCNNWVSSTKIAVDHIIPVVSVDDGFVDWNTFVERLWCDKINLQRICDFCHKDKTNKERTERLLKKYLNELDTIENNIVNFDQKTLKRTLSKYINKKKISGLYLVVQRAQDIKNKYCNFRS
jgi:5-methylcytosine-specific restriction endonuclease McrA